MNESAPASESDATPQARRREGRWTLLCACVCAAVILGWFSPWWAAGRVLAPLDVMHEMLEPWRAGDDKVEVKNHFVVDAIHNYLVYRLQAEEAYRTEGAVGWSSRTYGGTPQYANTMALYFDWTMQLHRCFDFWTAWHLGLLAQVLLAAWGMLLFLRGRGIGPLWAGCGALAYAANSQFVTWLVHRWALGSFCWVPWILWAADLHRGGKQRLGGVLVPVFLALAFLGGSLQHCAHVALVVVALWGEQAWRTGRSWCGQLGVLARHAGWGLLSTGLAAMMLVPCVAAYLESSRLGLHATAHMGLYPHGPLQPLLNLLAYPLQVLPSVLGRPGTMDAMKVLGSNLFFVASFGSLAVLVGYVAIFRKETPPLARLLIVIGLLLPLTPLVKYLYQRMLTVWIAGGVFAFADFMQHASPETRKRLAKVAGRIAALGGIAWLVASVGLTLKRDLVGERLRAKFLDGSGGGAFGHFGDWVRGRLDGFVTESLLWHPQQALPLALLAASLIGLAWTAATSEGRRRAGAWLVAGALLLELTLFAGRWITWSDPAKYPLFPETPEVAALREQVGRDGRVKTLIGPGATHMAETPFVPNTLAPYSIATIGGFDSIATAGMMSPVDPSTDARELGRLGISHLIGAPAYPPEGPGWTKTWESRSMALYANALAVPRYIGFAEQTGADAFLRREDGAEWIALKETSGLESSRRIELPAGIRSVRIAENHADGWQFRLPGSAAWQAVSRAPDASMRLDLPAATESPTTLELRFHPPLRRAGLLLSTIALLITLASAAVPRRRTLA